MRIHPSLRPTCVESSIRLTKELRITRTKIPLAQTPSQLDEVVEPECAEPALLMRKNTAPNTRGSNSNAYAQDGAHLFLTPVGDPV